MGINKSDFEIYIYGQNEFTDQNHFSFNSLHSHSWSEDVEFTPRDSDFTRANLTYNNHDTR